MTLGEQIISDPDGGDQHIGLHHYWSYCCSSFVQHFEVVEAEPSRIAESKKGGSSPPIPPFVGLVN
jgi:hypothetical protein